MLNDPSVKQKDENKSSTYNVSHGDNYISEGNVHIHFKDPYFKIPRALAQNKNLSLKAKGLFALIVSHGNGYDFAIERLSEESTDGIDSTSNGIKELENHKYLLRVKWTQPHKRIKKGIIVDGERGRVDYHIFEKQDDYLQWKLENKNPLYTFLEPSNSLKIPNLGKSGSRKTHDLSIQRLKVSTPLPSEVTYLKEPPLPPQGEHGKSLKKTFPRAEKDKGVLEKIFEEEMWNNGITPTSGRGGSKKKAFERWLKITKQGTDLEMRKKLMEGWGRYVAHMESRDLQVAWLETFLNPKNERWTDEHPITSQKPKAIEPSKPRLEGILYTSAMDKFGDMKEAKRHLKYLVKSGKVKDPVTNEPMTESTEIIKTFLETGMWNDLPSKIRQLIYDHEFPKSYDRDDFIRKYWAHLWCNWLNENPNESKEEARYYIETLKSKPTRADVTSLFVREFNRLEKLGLLDQLINV